MRCWHALVVLVAACGPNVATPSDSAEGTGSSSTSGSSSGGPTNDEGSTSIDTTGDGSGVGSVLDGLPETSLLPDSSSSGGSSTGPDELVECELREADNASVTLSVSAEVFELRYAAFAATGGGKCAEGYRIALVESSDAFIAVLGDLPELGNVWPRVELFVEAQPDELLPAGEYPVYINVAEQFGSGTIFVEAAVMEAAGATFTASIDASIEDPAITIQGTFTAVLCTDLDQGGCGA